MIVVGVAADLEIHAVGVAKEQRPLVAEPLDLADVGAQLHQPVAHALERRQGVDREAEVVDGAPPSLPAAVADDVAVGTSNTFKPAGPPRSSTTMRGWSGVASISKVTSVPNARA